LPPLGFALGDGLEVAFDPLTTGFGFVPQIGFALGFVSRGFVLSFCVGYLLGELLGSDLGMASDLFVELAFVGLVHTLHPFVFGLPLGFEGGLGEAVGPVFGLLAGLDLLGDAAGLGLSLGFFFGDQPFHFGFDLSPYVSLDLLLGMQSPFLSFLGLSLCNGKFTDQMIGFDRLRFEKLYLILGLEKLVCERLIRQQLGLRARTEIRINPFVLRVRHRDDCVSGSGYSYIGRIDRYEPFRFGGR